jgi:hypothetical protein
MIGKCVAAVSTDFLIIFYFSFILYLYLCLNKNLHIDDSISVIKNCTSFHFNDILVARLPYCVFTSIFVLFF